MGYMVKKARLSALARGEVYVEGSFCVLSLIKLTEAQYNALGDHTESED